MAPDNKRNAYEAALKVARKELSIDRKEAPVIKRVLHNIFSDLLESEDERIRKAILGLSYIDGIEPILTKCSITAQDIRTYLEKQKENFKSADSISSDCVSDAKCEDMWHKTANSLPDNGRDVLARDALGNYLLARYDGEGNWEVNVYDNEDYYCRNTITKWCEIPLEKQKEQKAELYDMGRWDEESYNNGISHVLQNPEVYGLTKHKHTEKQDYSGLNDLERVILRGFLVAGVENVPVGIIKDTASECIGFLALIDEKPAECADDVVEEAEEYTSKVACGEYGVEVTEAYIAGVLSERNRGTEWSEEDERILDFWLDVIDRNDWRMDENFCKASREFINRLKSLRPQPHTVSVKNATEFGRLEYERGVKDGIQFSENHCWKPSEEQMKILSWAANGMVDKCIAAPEMRVVLRELYDQLKKLI